MLCFTVSYFIAHKLMSIDVDVCPTTVMSPQFTTEDRPWLQSRPQAAAVSRIRRRIFVRRKSAEKVRLAKYAIRRQVVFT